MNFINTHKPDNKYQNDDLVSIDSSVGASVRPERLSPKQIDTLKYMGVYQSVTVPSNNQMTENKAMSLPQTSRSPRATKDV